MYNASGHAAQEAVSSHDVSLPLDLGFFVLPSQPLLMAERGSHSHKERGVEAELCCRIRNSVTRLADCRPGWQCSRSISSTAVTLSIAIYIGLDRNLCRKAVCIVGLERSRGRVRAVWHSIPMLYPVNGTL